MQDAEEPEHEKDNQYQSQSAAEPSSTILAIPVIATPAAEQQDDHTMIKIVPIYLSSPIPNSALPIRALN